MLSPTTIAVSIGAVQALGRGEKEIRVRLRVLHLIARHHRCRRGIDTQSREACRGRLHAAAGGDRPADARARQRGEQFARTGQRSNRSGLLLKGERVSLAQPLDQCSVDLEARLAQKLMREEAAAHPDLAVDAPHGQLDAFRVERALPGEDVLIDAVDERAVEIEQEARIDAHESRLPHLRRGP